MLCGNQRALLVCNGIWAFMTKSNEYDDVDMRHMIGITFSVKLKWKRIVHN